MLVFFFLVPSFLHRQSFTPLLISSVPGPSLPSSFPLFTFCHPCRVLLFITIPHNNPKLATSLFKFKEKKRGKSLLQPLFIFKTFTPLLISSVPGPSLPSSFPLFTFCHPCRVLLFITIPHNNPKLATSLFKFKEKKRGKSLLQPLFIFKTFTPLLISSVPGPSLPSSFPLFTFYHPCRVLLFITILHNNPRLATSLFKFKIKSKENPYFNRYLCSKQ